MDIMKMSGPGWEPPMMLEPVKTIDTFIYHMDNNRSVCVLSLCVIVDNSTPLFTLVTLFTSKPQTLKGDFKAKNQQFFKSFIFFRQLFFC